jgi:hypothetical protein
MNERVGGLQLSLPHFGVTYCIRVPQDHGPYDPPLPRASTSYKAAIWTKRQWPAFATRDHQNGSQKAHAA